MTSSVGSMATAAPPAAAAPPLSRAAANRAAFADGVRILLATWPLLQLAVTNEWGGPESTAKAEWLNEVILEVFDTKPKTEQFDLEDILTDILNAEFSTIAEDGSVQQIAAAVHRLFRECVQGNHSGVELLRQRYPAARAAAVAALQQSAADPAAAGSDSDDDSEDAEEDAGSSAAGAAQGHPAPADDADGSMAVDDAAAPAVDEDGWQTVPRRRNRH